MFETSGVINILDKNSKSVGTGFFVSPDGYILTCSHTLEKEGYDINDNINCCYMLNKCFEAQWIEKSTINSDLSILKANISQSISFYNLSSSIGCTGKVESYGFPRNKKNGIYAKAEVYGITKSPSGNSLIQLGNANDITYGLSGAPLVTQAGKVIGIISNIPKPDGDYRLINIAFAIPASIILESFATILPKSENVINDCDFNAVNFVGRESDINRYSKLIEENKVTVIQGMAGVGKTTLAFHLFNSFVKTPKLWITIRSEINNEVETVIYKIAEFLARNGQEKPTNMFYDLKNNSQTYEIAFNNLKTEIIKCVADLKLSIFIDDAHLINSDKNTINFFLALISECKDNKLIFVTRHSLDFVLNTTNGTPLRGLTKKDCKQMLLNAKIELSEAQIDSLYKKTQGNAKFLEVCIFSLLDRDRKSINDIINDISVNFNLNNYIQTNIVDRFTTLETKILNIIALCRMPIRFELVSKICLTYGYEDIYFSLDRFIRRNIVDRTNGDYYTMHALLKEHFSRLPSNEMLLLHHQIAENLNRSDWMEISYHYASCGRLRKALEILINNFDELVSKGHTSLMFKQLLSYAPLMQSEDEIPYNLLLGKLNLVKGQYDDVIFELTRMHFHTGEHYLFECFILLSQCYEKKGDYLNALRALEKAEKNLSVKDDVSLALVNINRGFLLCHQEQISRGIRLCEDGLQVIDKCSLTNYNLLADGYSSIGWNYTIKGDYSKAILSLNKSKSLYKNDSRGLALVNIRLARINWQKGNLREALNLINEAETLSNLTGDPQLQAFSLRQKNLILWNMGEFEKALDGHKESLKKYSKIKDSWGIAASLENVAAVLYDMGQDKKSMIYIDNAIKICININATDFLAYAYIYKSRILVNQGHISKAIYYAKQGIRLLKKWKYSNYYYGMALISLGIAYLSNKKIIRAVIILNYAEKKLLSGSALFQKHIASFYKSLCISKNHSIIDSCYEYFNLIGAKKQVQHLNKIELFFREGI